jgi:hypothetical protein
LINLLRSAALLSILSLLVGLASTDIGLFGSSGAQRHHPLDDTLLRAFRIFETPSERLSAADYRRVRANIENFESGAELQRTQLADSSHGSLWALTTSHLVCIVRTQAAACASKREAITIGVLLGVFSPPDQLRPNMHNFLVQGLVPDDVTQAVASHNGNRSIVVDAERNIISIAGHQPIQLRRLLRH